ncbi:unnamed protein product [Dibothriocephalus latus]|uniref:Uncharacterized protein n=1 Tax=Dibothriocephalus latus TaxID=60516 RepID=A0A3P7N9I7_DIBLA|nr:unnamed protein product [Dibothriocephalus latus]
MAVRETRIGERFLPLFGFAGFVRFPAFLYPSSSAWSSCPVPLGHPLSRLRIPSYIHLRRKIRVCQVGQQYIRFSFVHFAGTRPLTFCIWGFTNMEQMEQFARRLSFCLASQIPLLSSTHCKTFEGNDSYLPPRVFSWSASAVS